MVGTSKILTVSYGTFSCTLEGFDDSFNTMKAIAEYFRGLAADDRYFGAEPPTPDAEMLARIAEREIERRVEAHMGDSGIVLRAAALTDQSQDKQAAKAAEEAAADARVAAQAAEAKARAQADAEAKAKADAARAKAEAEAKAEAAAAKAEAEAAAAEAEAAAKAQADAEAEAAKAAQDAALAQAEADAEAEPEPEPVAEVSDPDSSLLDSVTAAAAAQTEPTAARQAEAPATNPVPAHNDTESVAAKLQRIRAVVTNAKANAPAEDDILSQPDAPDIADAIVDKAEPAPLLDDAAPETLATTNETAGEDDGTDMIARVMARHSEPQDDAATPDTDEADDAEAAKTEDAAPRARIVRMKRADFEKAVAQNAKLDAPAAPDLGMLDGADELDSYLEDSDFDDSDLSFDDDLAQDTQEADDDASEVSGIADTDAKADTDTGQGGKTTNHSAFKPDVAEVDDAALDRLMSETDAQMKEPEGSRRRDAIAQLKAAVAAKEAARQIGEPDDDDQDVENAFRNDLSKVVQPEQKAPVQTKRPMPRPVVRTETRTERPRPAPLKLVAAQRVDLAAAAQARPEGPVVPRRVAASDKDAAQVKAAGSFAEFAENMGATELPDLLEAAAAYTAFVEGADEFSRPQILRRVRAVASDDFNREDGLRSFADLLRAGRFTKVRNGRFQVADDTRFNPERRAG